MLATKRKEEFFFEDPELAAQLPEFFFEHEDEEDEEDEEEEPEDGCE